MPKVLFYPVQRVHYTQLFGVAPAYYKPMRGHNGLDFRTAFAGVTPKGNVWVTPMAPGRVVEVGNQGRTGYGRFVRLEHDDGAQSVYAHFKEQYVKVGARVGTGTVIGLTDSTGRSTGPHLHVGYRPAGWQKRYYNGYYGYIDFKSMLVVKPGFTKFFL